MASGSVHVRDLPADARDAFVALGHKQRHFFAHRVIRLPKGGVDGLKLARRMVGDVRPDQLRQIILHALPSATDEFPPDVFFDDDIIWHQQHFGLPGHVATASLVIDGSDVYAPTLVSDLVQRIGRRRSLKTRIESRFKGWARLLVHAALDFARDQGAQRLLVPEAGLALQHTDPARDPQSALFEWVYDHSVGAPFVAVRDGRWWALDVQANSSSMLSPSLATVELPTPPEVFVCHDIERGWGHLNDDPTFAASADVSSQDALAGMLAVEHEVGVPATYAVLGILFEDLSPRVREHRHALAFHSFDHADSDEHGVDRQLGRCRAVDYRVKGYRPPRSRLGPELTDANLAFHNFEWLASSVVSLQARTPRLDNGIVRIPILTDDYELYRGLAYERWESDLLASCRQAVSLGDSAVLSLHDCYASWWLPRYRELLRKLSDIGAFGTLDERAAHTLLTASR